MIKSPVIARKKDSDTMFRLVVSYIIVCCNKDIRIPACFCFDGCSIPRALWRICGHPLSPRYLAAALVHDWLYKIKGQHDWGYDMTRLEVDELFYDMLRADGVGWIKANLLYRGVRTGGWLSFRKYTPIFTEE
tara:strand:+ start:19769 stop:20167 length:399 start_codon:yes stop_codon:yes gene_type:complete